MDANRIYTAAVERGEFPGDNHVPIVDGFRDERGEIRNLLLAPITSVALITSQKWAVRANHYHKTDWHYAYVVKGCVAYFERDIGSHDIPPAKLFVTGQMFFTPPMREHAMVFAEDTTIMTFAKNVRDHEHHEEDVVRVEFITPAIAARYVP